MQVFLSMIFNWYGDDFKKAAGSVESFIGPYLGLSKEERIRLSQGKIKINFLPYDWELNEGMKR